MSTSAVYRSLLKRRGARGCGSRVRLFFLYSGLWCCSAGVQLGPGEARDGPVRVSLQLRPKPLALLHLFNKLWDTTNLIPKWSGQYIIFMSIVTKTGDQGDTSLWSEERVGKDDLRVEAYGTIDEFSSNLGVARHLCLQDDVLYAIEDIQRLCFRIAGELASKANPFDRPIKPSDEAVVPPRYRPWKSGYCLPVSCFLV